MNVVLTLQFQETGEPYLADITNLLYDLELAYDFGVLASEPVYSRYRFNRYFWYRKGRPIRKDHRMRVHRIVHQSPLLLEIVGTITGIWVLIQIVEKVQNWPLNRRKLELDVEKLERENRAAREGVAKQYAEELEALRRTLESSDIPRKLEDRLSQSPLQLEKLEVDVKDPPDPPHD